MRWCLSLPFGDVSALLACDEIERARQSCPSLLLELRAERFGAQAPQALAAVCQRFGAKRIVVACRGPAPGAPREPVADAALQDAVWAQALRLGVHAIDIDAMRFDADPASFRRPFGSRRASGGRRVVRLVSEHWHARVPTPQAARQAWHRRVAQGADVVKFAFAARPLASALALWRALAKTPGEGRLLLVPMGEGGTWGRLLAAQGTLAPPWMYVRLQTHAPTAAGQIDWQQAQGRYRRARRAAGAQVYGILGHPLGHSASPAVHNALLAAWRRDALYVPFDCAQPRDAQAVLADGPHALGLRGLSVTLPYKQMAYAHAAHADALTHACGAANTLLWGADGWRAHNTDAQALCTLLRPLLRATGLRVLVVGAGGTARAACAALAALGATPLLWARRPRAADALAQRFLGHRVTDVAQALPTVDGVIHCTPVGMAPMADASVFTDAQLSRVPPHAFVLDAVYRPKHTRLWRQASACGLQAVDGEQLFLAQARAQCALLYERTPTLLALQRALAAP